MSKKMLQIGDGLSLPAEEFIESATALVSQRGRGKSGGVRVIEEELLHHRLPFVTLDPVSIHWGLRSSFNGKEPSGHELLVVGGEHGDIPLERRGGEDVARGIVEDNVSAVIDLGGQTKSAQREFVRDFADGLYRLNNASRLVVLEETPEFAPQRLISAEIAQTFEAVERIVRLGRNKGLGALLVGQRPATINKDLLTQVDSIICLGINSPQDRKALKEWVEQNAEPDRLKEFMDGISALDRQEAWIWSPAQLKLFRRFRFRDFTTLHPDKTHLRRLGLLKTVPAQTDVSGLVQRLQGTMKTLAEKRKAEDPKTLRTQVAQLERELAAARNAKPPAPKVERVEVPVIPSGQVKALGSYVEKLDAVAAKATEAANSIRGLLGVHLRLAAPAPAPRPAVAPRPAPRPAPRAVEGEAEVKAGARRMLQELASRYPLKLTRAQLGTLVGITPSGGTYGTYFGTLKRLGFLTEAANGDVEITKEGLDYVGTDVPPAPATTRELLDRWRKSLKAGAAEMLDVLVAVHPQGMTRHDLGERTGITATGGTFGTYLGILRRNGLVEVQGDEVRASDTLFITGRPG